jgi:hypothetical protein
VVVTLECIDDFEHGSRHFNFRYSVTCHYDIANIIRNIDALNTPLQLCRICQENAGNSVDEFFPCERIAIAAIFITGVFCSTAFPVTPNDHVSCTHHQDV